MVSDIKLHVFLAALACAGVRAPSSALHANSNRQIRPKDLLPDVLDQYPKLSNYTALVLKYPAILYNIVDYLGVTLLAPTDEAFAKNPNFDINNETEVVPLLQYHIIQEQVFTNDIIVMEPRFFPTLLLNDSYTNITGGQRVTAIRQDEDEYVFVSGLDSRALLMDEMRDIHFFEGIIQPIDTFLVPPPSLEVTTRVRMESMYAFLGALYKTGLADKVMAQQNVTIFVPSNEAFQKVFGSLSEFPDAELRNLLNYHILPNKVLYSTDLNFADDFAYKTAAMGYEDDEPLTLSVTLAGNERWIDTSQIIDPDVLIANGVVHIISDILNPRKPNVRPDPAKKHQDPVFELTGITKTGTRVPTPYFTNLPCTTNCPETQIQTSTTQAPRPTRLRNAVGPMGVPNSVMGLVGAGILAAGAL